MNSREQFETWYRETRRSAYDEPDLGIDSRSQYLDTHAHEAWVAWQASRACATPEWEHAPDWANWLAMDPKGGWWWSEAQPEARSAWWHNAWGKRISQAGMTPGRSNWTETLEQRPWSN